ncbi:MAG: beta-N-acetylhexosaminidase [Paludibacter sp.]
MRKANLIYTIRFFIVLMLLINSISLLSANEYNIIPYPQQLTPLNGTFIFNSETRISCDLKEPDILKLAQQFTNQLKLVSGLNIKINEFSGFDTTNTIIFKKITYYNPEAYRLNISTKNIRIESGSANGFFYGLQTLYQLMPPKIYGKKRVFFKKWSVPAVQITDTPRFQYRGLHLDVGRHFFPVSFIKKYIDAMAIHKLNYFHWHLTEDQGWRIQIKKYPRLTEIGSKRGETLIGYYYNRCPQEYDGKPYGGFYTQDEAREIVAYAAERFITVIPEIEMPGHAQAALASYPYLSCRRDSTLKVATKWGIFPDVYCPRDTTFKFLEDVLTDILAIFPSKYIHIGGDECPKERWKVCPDCQARIQNVGLKDENGLQSYFIHRIEKFLNSKGRKIIGWDEILDGGLAPNATVMSWRGTRGGEAAAKAGNDVIMTPGATCYFNFYQSDPVSEPLAFGGYLPLSAVYNYEPVPTSLNPTEAIHVLGAQANLWTEYISTTEQAEYMAFPRVSAMSEVLWSDTKNRNWDSFRYRIPTEFERYKELNIKPSKTFYDVRFQATPTTDNKLKIKLLCDFPNAKIIYNINGKNNIYKEPFILPESATIYAKATINGHLLGKEISKHFIVSELTGRTYTKSVNNTWYLGGNQSALTDGISGNKVTYSEWVGIGNGKDCEILFDLKDSVSISRCSVGLLHAPALCVVIPSTIKVFGSKDGVNYNTLSELQLPKSDSPYWEIFRPEFNITKSTVRYLKFELKTGGDCPTISPDKMDGSMMFIDEICAW